MLVHFIGGPAHGRSEVIQNPQPIYRTAEFKGDFAATVPFAEHEYKITKRTPRYAIAEWVAPAISVRFLVELEIDPTDSEASQALYEFVFERRMDRDGDVKCVGGDISCGEKATLTLVTLVEGPDDPTAIGLAAEKVQHYLDANAPLAIQRIQHTSATTD